jgi:hypothetical protein
MPPRETGAAFSVCQKAIVGATIGRPQILHGKICRRQAKHRYFPSDDPQRRCFVAGGSMPRPYSSFPEQSLPPRETGAAFFLHKKPL